MKVKVVIDQGMAKIFSDNEDNEVTEIDGGLAVGVGPFIGELPVDIFNSQMAGIPLLEGEIKRYDMGFTEAVEAIK